MLQRAIKQSKNEDTFMSILVYGIGFCLVCNVTFVSECWGKGNGGCDLATGICDDMDGVWVGAHGLLAPTVP